jgi:hypothetical protein
MTTPTLPTDHNCVTFTTETGSVYRVDFTSRTIERLSGVGQSTARVGEGARRFENLLVLEVGSPCVINWGVHAAVKAATGNMPTTITSRVKSIT